jgi:hypothetical protein
MSRLAIVKLLRQRTIKTEFMDPENLKENENETQKYFVNVLIRDKKYRQYCGEGKQKIRWLTDCAIFKYENEYKRKRTCGIAYGLKNENGELCDLDSKICECLTNGAHVLVLLKEEYESEIRERERKIQLEKESINRNQSKRTSKNISNNKLINKLNKELREKGDDSQTKENNIKNEEEEENKKFEEEENKKFEEEFKSNNKDLLNDEEYKKFLLENKNEDENNFLDDEYIQNNYGSNGEDVNAI